MNDNLKAQITKNMHKAFWNLIEDDLKKTPQDFKHIIVLIDEIRSRLCKLTPNNVKLQNEINEKIDPEFLKQIFTHNVFTPQHFFDIINFIISKIQLYCSPSDDKLLNEWKQNVYDLLAKDTINYCEFLQFFIPSIHEKIDKIEDQIKKYFSENNSRT